MGFMRTAGVVLVAVSLLAPTGKAVALSGREMPDIPEDASPTKIEQIFDEAFFGVKNMQSFTYSLNDVEVLSSGKFSDVANKHWASDSIGQAVEKGYVSGYDDGSFKPDRQVTRAEFISMVMRSDRGFQVSGEGSPWYTKFVQSAIDYGFISKDEYSTGDYNTPMSRLEMAKVAVRAANLNANSNEEYILVATKNGLLHGMGEGKLNLTGTTTRAQSVAIIERILAVRAGKELPTDAFAIKAAESNMNKVKDAWGDTIRTTDLPKNANYYPYILDHIPNEVYEKLVHPNAFDSDPLDLTQSASEIYSHPGYTKESKDSVASTISNYGNLVFNIDYRTIDDKWIEDVYSIPNMSARVNEDSIMERFRTRLEDYVEYVKDNKIVMSGSMRAEMSTLSRTAVDYYVVVKADIVVHESSLFNNSKPLTAQDFIYGSKSEKNPPSLDKDENLEWYFLMMLAGNGSIKDEAPMTSPNLLYGYVLDRE